MIAAVQMKLNAEDYKTEQSFKRKIHKIMTQIREESGKGRLLVVFPEHIGTFCLLCNAPHSVWQSGSFAKATTTLLGHNFLSVAKFMLTGRLSPVKALFLAKSAEIERIYLSTFIEASKHYEAWIVAGTGVLRWGETKRLFNTSPIITPTGTVIHRQHKVNLVEMESKGGLDLDSAPINYLSVARSPFGNLGLTICLDAFHEDARKRLADLDANILLQPSANNGPWNEWQQDDWLRSSFEAVVERKEFDLAINPMLVGSLWDLKFEGQSSIIDQQGYVARAESYDQEEILLKKDLLN